MYNNNKVNATVQARMNSTRLPGKVLLDLAGKPVLQHIIERLRRSKYIDNVIIATTDNPTDDVIIDLCQKLDCLYYRGSEDDVLQRVLDAAKYFKTDIIVEITADCPCVDSHIVDALIERLKDFDYISNVINRTFPRGLDVQVFSTVILERVNKEVDNPIDRQHVSSWIYKNPKNAYKYKYAGVTDESNYSHLRLTLDTEKDYQLLKFLFEALPNDFANGDIYNFFNKYPELVNFNSEIQQKSYYEELGEWYSQNTQS